ncbi:MAG: hypothetical protein ACREID_03380, partial [Planctomycetota bacterium]
MRLLLPLAFPLAAAFAGDAPDAFAAAHAAFETARAVAFRPGGSDDVEAAVDRFERLGDARALGPL